MRKHIRSQGTEQKKWQLKLYISNLQYRIVKHFHKKMLTQLHFVALVQFCYLFSLGKTNTHNISSVHLNTVVSHSGGAACCVSAGGI